VITALYRKGYLIQSEFVAYEETRHDSQQKEALAAEVVGALGASARELALPCRPRFFTPRERATTGLSGIVSDRRPERESLVLSVWQFGVPGRGGQDRTTDGRSAAVATNMMYSHSLLF
jgi:hypothetical protein